MLKNQFPEIMMVAKMIFQNKLHIPTLTENERVQCRCHIYHL